MLKKIQAMSATQYLAGKVKRWHTCVGMEQTNADHSHGVIMVIALLHPNPSANLLKAAAAHDLGEFITGDMLSPAKSDPVIRDRLKQLESEGRHSMGIPDWPLTEEEQKWLEFADAYETFMFITYVAQNGPSVSHLNYQMVLDKMDRNARALGITFDINLDGHDPQHGPQNGEKVQ
jgi:5'-deoxynucleotidase YfbR-like HD superfamily hydrolase